MHLQHTLTLGFLVVLLAALGGFAKYQLEVNRKI